MYAVQKEGEKQNKTFNNFLCVLLHLLLFEVHTAD